MLASLVDDQTLECAEIAVGHVQMLAFLVLAFLCTVSRQVHKQMRVLRVDAPNT